MDRAQIELQLDRIWQNHKESRPPMRAQTATERTLSKTRGTGNPRVRKRSEKTRKEIGAIPTHPDGRARGLPTPVPDGPRAVYDGASSTPELERAAA